MRIRSLYSCCRLTKRGDMQYRFRNPIDQGYSWVLLIACFVIYMISMGIVKGFGILYSELLETYQKDAGDTASIGSITTFLQSVLSPVVVSMCVRFSFRMVMFLGGIIIATGLFLSSFATKMEHLFFTYSLVTGIGLAMTFAPCLTLVNFFFEKRRGLANGLVLSASGVGGFLFPYIYTLLFDNFGVSGGLMLLSSVVLNTCVAASIIRQPSLYSETDIRKKVNKVSEKKIENQSNFLMRKVFSVITFVRSSIIIEWSFLKNVKFMLYNLAFLFGIYGYGINFYMLPVYVTTRGHSKKVVALVMSILGVTELFARIFLGWFLDLKIINAKYVYIISLLISGVGQICITFISSLELFCVYAGIVGIFSGTVFTFIPLLLLEIIELAKLPSAYALSSVMASLFNVIMVPVIGWMKDYFDYWDPSWYFVGSVTLLSPTLVLFEICLQKHGSYSKSNAEHEIRDALDMKLNTDDTQHVTDDVSIEEETPMMTSCDDSVQNDMKSQVIYSSSTNRSSEAV